MLKSMLKPIPLITIMVMFFLVQFPLPRVMAQTPALSVQPPGVFGLVPAQFFSVDVVVTDAVDLRTWQFVMYYRSSVLNITGFGEGPFMKSDGASTFVASDLKYDYNATHGRLLMSCSRTNPSTGIDGTGILATVTFYTLNYGFSLIHLGSNQDDPDYYCKLINSSSQLIPHTRSDGQAYVGTRNVAVTSIDTPTTIPQGLIAYINVTAQNRGEFQATFDVTLTYSGTPIDGVQTIIDLPTGESRTVTFAWDILLLPLGQYNLTATATAVPGEFDLSDNTISLMVQLGAVDLAVTNVAAKTIVGQEYPLTGNVTVANQGEFSGTSNVTVYLNQGYVNQTIIATFQNVTLASGSSISLNFTKNATILIGNYTLSAYVQPVAYETDTMNNNFTSPIAIMVGIPGDIVSPFGVVDMKDVAYVAKRFGTLPGAPLWDEIADLNSSGKVDMKDIAIVAKNFGQHYP
jgi:hypothetical protein